VPVPAYDRHSNSTRPGTTSDPLPRKDVDS